jgi:hypothetical protein
MADRLGDAPAMPRRTVKLVDPELF